ncbi:MAG: trypsin-like peptidase domain-containing protein [Solirubrobacterales bacterium]
MRVRRLRGGGAAGAATAALAAAVLAGCGSDGSGGQTAATTTPVRTTTTEVVVQTASRGFDAARVYRQAAPGVVTIRSIFGGGGGLLGATAAEGSGFVLDSEGHIVTNAHVVTEGSGGDRTGAERVFVEFPDRNVVPAEIVGFDPFADVALLKVDPEGLDLHPLRLGNDSALQVGQPVAAIGSPFGEQQSLSVGIVSATDRSVKSLTQFQIEGAIQTDASINPGNSGGPLLDAAARVIGINQQIETQSGANDGVGFAVPISAVKRSVAQLRDSGEASYAYIGVSSQSLYPQLARRLGLDTRFGGLIAEVVPGGPADDAGLKGGSEKIQFQAGTYTTGGDVILSVDGRPVIRPDDLARQISSYRPGDKVRVAILRDGQRRVVEVTLGTRPVATN